MIIWSESRLPFTFCYCNDPRLLAPFREDSPGNVFLGSSAGLKALHKSYLGT